MTFFQNKTHYPTADEKAELAREAGYTTMQVNNWFINARKRIARPIERGEFISEVYMDLLNQAKPLDFPLGDSDAGCMAESSRNVISVRKTDQAHLCRRCTNCFQPIGQQSPEPSPHASPFVNDSSRTDTASKSTSSYTAESNDDSSIDGSIAGSAFDGTDDDTPPPLLVSDEAQSGSLVGASLGYTDSDCVSLDVTTACTSTDGGDAATRRGVLHSPIALQDLPWFDRCGSPFIAEENFFL